MAEIKGLDVLINVNTGTAEVPEFTKVAGQRGATLSRSVDTLETTSKNTEGFKDFEYSFKEWSIEADGLLVDGDEAFNALEEAFMNSEKVLVQMAFPSGKQYKGLAVISEIPIEAPYDDMATYSVTLQGAGKLEKLDQ